MKRNVVILFLLMVILVIEIIILAPGEVGIAPEDQAAMGPHIPLAPNNREASQEIKDLHLVEAKGEVKEWELLAKQAVRPKDDPVWKLEDVNVKFFGENGVFYVVTGRQGSVVSQVNDIRINGDVVVRSSNGYTFKTESVFYQSVTRLLTSPTRVEMTGPKEADGSSLRLTGVGLKANLATNELEVANQVQARKNISSGKTAQISSKQALFSGVSKYARFNESVVIEVQGLRIMGPEAIFTYGAKSEMVESILVSGGVTVTDADKTATAEEVQMFMVEDKYVFRGSPKVLQDGDELNGDEIIFLEGGRRVKVSNARGKVETKDLETKSNAK